MCLFSFLSCCAKHLCALVALAYQIIAPCLSLVCITVTRLARTHEWESQQPSAAGDGCGWPPDCSPGYSLFFVLQDLSTVVLKFLPEWVLLVAFLSRAQLMFIPRAFPPLFLDTMQRMIKITTNLYLKKKKVKTQIFLNFRQQPTQCSLKHARSEQNHP